MATTKHNREVRRQLAELAGDPREMDVTATKNATPYTRTQQSGDPADQFSELITCRIDGQLMRLIEEQVQGLYPYYRTKSDYVRDAIFKWARHLHQEWFGPNAGAQEPLVKQLELISRQAYETQQHRNFAAVVAALSDNLYDLVRAPGGVEKLAEEVAEYAEKIQDIDDTYWRSRTIANFVGMPSFETVLQTLKTDPRYADTPLVKLLSTWGSQRFAMRQVI